MANYILNAALDLVEQMIILELQRKSKNENGLKNGLCVEIHYVHRKLYQGNCN